MALGRASFSFGFLFAFDFASCAPLPVVASRASARASLLYFCLMVTLRGEGKRAKERDIWIKKIEVSLPFCFIFSFLVFGSADARPFVVHMALRWVLLSAIGSRVVFFQLFLMIGLRLLILAVVDRPPVL